MAFSIFPRTVYRTESKISGLIEVKEQLGQYTLHVQGLIQSGGIMRGIWQKPLKRITCYVPRIIHVLVLGLGGGTVVHLIKSRWPEAKIVGLEIDPEVIRIGKKFFGLDEIEHLEVVQGDAIKAISNPQHHSVRGGQQLAVNNFGLIVVDLYLGRRFPKKAASKEFLEGIKKLLAKDGVVILNRLRRNENNLLSFEQKLKQHFSSLKKIETSTNYFFIAEG